MYRYLLALLISSSALLIPSVAFAQTPTCTIIYGGGETDCGATGSAAAKLTATPEPATNAADTNTTKGGLPVNTPTNATQTPATGPEAFGLLALIPAAAAGFYLRKKS